MIGILLIAIGSLAASSFYVPFKKVKVWAWESYWISQGLAAWIICPWVFALLTVPSGTLTDIIHDAPTSAKWLSIMFGALWGVGGLTFGLSIRYMGIALGQSLVLGLTAALGTLIPSIVAGENLFASRAGILTMIGVAVALAGITIVGYAGILKNKSLTEEERKAAVKDFALKKRNPDSHYLWYHECLFCLWIPVGETHRRSCGRIRHPRIVRQQSHPHFYFTWRFCYQCDLLCMAEY